MAFLMMNTSCSIHVEDAKNWIKTLIWKVCICWFALHNCITMHGTKNIKFFKNTFVFPQCTFCLPLHFQTNDSVISILNPCCVSVGTFVCLQLSGFFVYISNYSLKLLISFWFSCSVGWCFIFAVFPCSFLSVFAKLWKVTISLVMPVHLSAWNSLLPLDGFSWNLLYVYF